MSNLFQKQRFKMHSGGMSDFKIECDAITLENWKTCAFMVSRMLSFKKVIGISRGGLMFAECLKNFEIAEAKTVLIADDFFYNRKIR